MNKRCYCSRLLEYDNDVPSRNCINCCRDLSPANDEAIYTCFEDESNCIYRKLRDYYYVCSDCYEEDSEEIKHDWALENKAQFILKKFTHSISSTS